MDLKLEGKVVFVAGASRGIGLAITEALLAEGATVALAARGEEALESVRARLAKAYGEQRVWARAGDMRETAVIEAALGDAERDLGPLWGVVANVGLHPCPPGFEVDDEAWRGGFEQNLDSSFRLARAALRAMTPRGEGAVLFISSIAGMGALGSPISYGASKAAMNHLSKELARIAGPTGVRVNTIAPGNIIFPGGTWEERSNGPRGDSWKRWIDREVAMKRLAAWKKSPPSWRSRSAPWPVSSPAR